MKRLTLKKFLEIGENFAQNGPCFVMEESQDSENFELFCTNIEMFINLVITIREMGHS